MSRRNLGCACGVAGLLDIPKAGLVAGVVVVAGAAYFLFFGKKAEAAPADSRPPPTVGSPEWLALPEAQRAAISRARGIIDITLRP